MERLEGIDSKLNPNQYGFRKERSTDAALHQLISRLEDTFFKGDFTLGIFLDIEGTFDNISFSAIEFALERFGTNWGVIRWISNMLRSRTLTISIGEATLRRHINHGCPQGGVLSPLLWNLVIDELLWIFRNQLGYLQAYADDLTLLEKGSDLTVIWQQAQHSLNLLERWATHKGLKFSHLKTVLILFTNKRKWTVPAPLTLYNKDLKLSKNTKYLGVVLDSKLSWRPHIDSRISYATICLLQCKRIVGGTWGISPAKMMWVYTSIIRPILAYASLVWINAINRKAIVSKLNKLQGLACRIIASAYPSTPTAALEAIMALSPLDLYLKETAILTARRLKRDNLWCPINERHRRENTCSHRWICETEMDLIPNLSMPADDQTPELVWDLPCEIEILAKEEAIESARNTTADVVCFTDGSLADGRAGAGLVIYGFDPGGQTSFCLGGMATVFQCEVFALQKLSELLLSSKLQDKDITIFSDSQAAIKALKGTRFFHKSVKQCHSLLTELNSKNRVQLCWIPGHHGVEGNETADQRAKAGGKLEICAPETIIPISATTCRNAVRDKIHSDHSIKWSNMSTCRQSREALPRIDGRLSREILSLDRSTIRLIIQVITGHGNLNKHNYLTGKSATPLCPKCEENPETSEHYVGKCPAYDLKRLLHFGKTDLTLCEILQNGEITNLTRYLKDTGRLLQF